MQFQPYQDDWSLPSPDPRFLAETPGMRPEALMPAPSPATTGDPAFPYTMAQTKDGDIPAPPSDKFNWDSEETLEDLHDGLVEDTHFGMLSMVAVLIRSLLASRRARREGRPSGKHVHWRMSLIIVCVVMPIVQITLITTFGISAIRQGINGPELGKGDGVYMFFDSSKPFCSRTVNATMQEWLDANGATAHSSGSENLFFVALLFALWTYIVRSWFASFYLYKAIQKKKAIEVADPEKAAEWPGAIGQEKLEGFDPVVQFYFLYPIPAILDRVLHLCFLSFTLGVTTASMYLVNRIGLMVVNAFALLCIEELDDGLKAWFFNADREKLLADTVRQSIKEKLDGAQVEFETTEAHWIYTGRRVFFALLILASVFLFLITGVLIYFLVLTGMGCKPGTVNSISLYG